MRRGLVVAGVILFGCVTAACGSSEDFRAAVPTPSTVRRTPIAAPNATTPAPAPAYDTVDITDPPLRFEVPHAWESFDLNKRRVDQIIDALQASNPRAADVVRRFAAKLPQATRFFAIDPNISGPEAGNINVISFPPTTLDEATIATIREQLSLVGATAVNIQQMPIDGVDSVRVDYEAGLAAGAGNVQFRGVQAYIPGRTATAVITVTLPSASGTAIADRLIASIRVGKTL